MRIELVDSLKSRSVTHGLQLIIWNQDLPLMDYSWQQNII